MSPSEPVTFLSEADTESPMASSSGGRTSQSANAPSITIPPDLVITYDTNDPLCERSLTTVTLPSNASPASGSSASPKVSPAESSGNVTSSSMTVVRPSLRTNGLSNPIAVAAATPISLYDSMAVMDVKSAVPSVSSLSPSRPASGPLTSMCSLSIGSSVSPRVTGAEQYSSTTRTAVPSAPKFTSDQSSPDDVLRAHTTALDASVSTTLVPISTLSSSNATAGWPESSNPA